MKGFIVNKKKGETITPSDIVHFEESESTATAGTSYWKDKTWVTLGDSITATGVYQNRVIANTGITLTENHADPGETMMNYGSKPIVGQYNNIAGTPDLITVMGGTNDFGMDMPLGAITDTSSNTEYGAIRVLCQQLLGGWPTTRVIFFTNIHRTDMTVNGLGHTLEDYNDAIRLVCAQFAIPVIDLYKLTGFSAPNASTYLTADLIHPKSAGYNRMGDVISAELERFKK